MVLPLRCRGLRVLVDSIVDWQIARVDALTAAVKFRGRLSLLDAPRCRRMRRLATQLIPS